MSFPVYLTLGPWRLHPHWAFEALAYFAGFRLFLAIRRRDGDPIAPATRWSVITATILGAALGSRLLFLLESPSATVAHLDDPYYLFGGKTIVGGLLGGLIAVEATKRWIGERHATGDLFAVPLAVGIAIGRIGCFLSGPDDHTAGVGTTMPWGVDFGDGIPRHPAALYEAVAMMLLAVWLYRARRRHAHEGDRFKQFMVSYMAFRLVIDGLKPDPDLALGLSALQWAAVLTLGYYARDIARWCSASIVGPPGPAEAGRYISL